MIKSIKFKKDFRKIFEADSTIEFRPGINIIVGDAGSGKSSLLNIIEGRIRLFNKENKMPEKSIYGSADKMPYVEKSGDILDVDLDLHIYEGDKGKTLRWQKIRTIDFELDNPRIKTLFDDDDKVMNAEFQIDSLKASHGQSNMAWLAQLYEASSVERAAVILDEADSALSIRGCTQLVNMFLKLVNDKKCQVFASIQNPIVLQWFEEVYSVEHHEWMDPQEFIRDHMKGVGEKIAAYTNEHGGLV